MQRSKSRPETLRVLSALATAAALPKGVFPGLGRLG